MTKAMTRILVADNEEDSMKTLVEILKGQYPFLVYATNPHDAQTILNADAVDVAILDLRLTNDLNDHDISGLTVAKSTNPAIPKILVTKFENEPAMRKALGANVDGLPSAIAFLYWGELADQLLPKVALALEINKSRFRRSQDQISERLTDDYDHAKMVAHIHIWLSFLLSIIFVVPVAYGVLQLHTATSKTDGALAMVFILIGSLGAEITNYIVAKKLEFLYERVDRFHTELLQASKLDQMLALCDEIDETSERRHFKASILDAVLERWKTTNDNQSQIPSETR